MSEWDDCCSDSFEYLKRASFSSSILVCFNLNLLYYLYLDLSEESLSTMLVQPYVIDGTKYNPPTAFHKNMLINLYRALVSVKFINLFCS